MPEKLSFRLSMLKEKVAEPDLGKMGLIFIGCVYFFYCVKGFCFKMKALPYFGEASST